MSPSISRGGTTTTITIACYVPRDFGTSATYLLRVVTQSITNALPVPMLRQVYVGPQKLRFCLGGVQKMGSWRCQLHFLITSSYLEASWANLGHLGALLGPSGVILGSSWGHLGPSWAILGPSWGPSWGPLGASLGLLGPPGVIMGYHGLLWAILGASWGHLGGILGSSWGYLGSSWGHLGPS